MLWSTGERRRTVEKRSAWGVSRASSSTPGGRSRCIRWARNKLRHFSLTPRSGFIAQIHIYRHVESISIRRLHGAERRGRTIVPRCQLLHLVLILTPSYYTLYSYIPLFFRSQNLYKRIESFTLPFTFLLELSFYNILYHMWNIILSYNHLIFPIVNDSILNMYTMY